MSQFEPEGSEMEEELSQTGNGNASLPLVSGESNCVFLDYFPEQDQESIEQENEQLVKNVNVDATNFTDSLKLLQEHGITMLQTDENEDGNILNSVMESGHSVVLTGKKKTIFY